jgi:RNA polymerase sigma-70 factor (ECF subfamily)
LGGGASDPTRTTIDEVVRVEKDDTEHDREGDDGHEASLEDGTASGQVSVKDLNGPTSTGNGSEVAAAALSFLPATRPHMPPPSDMTASGERPIRVPDPGPVSIRPREDDTLVSRAASGDTEAFKGLFQRHRADVARLVYRMLSAPADLDDVVQEVFVQVFRSLKDFRGQSKFSTWLHRVTVNVVLMHRRSARSRPVLTEEAPSDLVADERQTLPDEDAERHERMRAFERLLARLADKKRIVFVLHELEGLSPTEIADVVGAPVLTVRTRLFYARRELEAMLPDEPSLAGLAASFTRKDEAR